MPKTYIYRCICVCIYLVYMCMCAQSCSYIYEKFLQYAFQKGICCYNFWHRTDNSEKPSKIDTLVSTNTGCTKFNQDPDFYYGSLINQATYTHFQDCWLAEKPGADVDLAKVNLIELNLLQIQSLLLRPFWGPSGRP